MPATDVSSIPPTITAYAKALLETLRQEYAILSQNDIAALEQITAIKHQLAAELDVQFQQNPAAANNPDSELHGIIDECQRQNITNGAIINASRQHAELALNVLRGQPLAAQLYDASGATSTDLKSNSLGRV